MLFTRLKVQEKRSMFTFQPPVDPLTCPLPRCCHCLHVVVLSCMYLGDISYTRHQENVKGRREILYWVRSNGIVLRVMTQPHVTPSRGESWYKTARWESCSHRLVSLNNSGLQTLPLTIAIIKRATEDWGGMSTIRVSRRVTAADRRNIPNTITYP